MEIIKSTIEVRKIEAPEGHYLTRTNYAEGEERTYTKVAFLAQGESEDNWRLAEESEKKEYEAAQAAEAAAERETI